MARRLLRWLRVAWGDASRRQKVTIVVALLVTLGALGSLESPPGPGPGTAATRTPFPTASSTLESAVALVPSLAPTPTVPLVTAVPTIAPTASPTAAPTSPPTLSPTPAPTARATPGATAAPSLSLVFTSLTSPVNPGANATAKVKTSPGAYCTIVVEYKSGPSKAAGLGPKTAGSTGVVSWTWKVGSRTTAGSWPVTVTCSKGALQKSVTKDLVVL